MGSLTICQGSTTRYQTEALSLFQLDQPKADVKVSVFMNVPNLASAKFSQDSLTVIFSHDSTSSASGAFEYFSLKTTKLSCPGHSYALMMFKNLTLCQLFYCITNVQSTRIYL